jgi:hypothetical protein
MCIETCIISKTANILDALGVCRRNQKGNRMRKAKKQVRRSKETKRCGMGTIVFKN